VCQAACVDATDARHRAAVAAAWEEYGDPRKVAEIRELSAMVSTNRVYRLTLDDATPVIVKSSNYGSFFLFAEDHDRLHRTKQMLAGTRFEHLLAGAYTRDGEPYIWYDGEMWVIFYEEVEARDRLPAILTEEQVTQLGTEMANFHKACAALAPMIPPASKTAKSDAVHLFDMARSRNAGDQLGLDPSRIDLVRRHAHRFLMAIHESGYDAWTKMPVLIDWNLGNFSVAFAAADRSRFSLFSRWDYDWFRIESRLLDFYFLSRVSSRTGDRTSFTYAAHTLLEPRFRTFLKAYHSVYPLTAPEVLFLKEAYRFFLLNYVVREGRHFFRYDFWQHLLHDAVDVHLPRLDDVDLTPLLEELQL
jgi:hypothetical protein